MKLLQLETAQTSFVVVDLKWLYWQADEANNTRVFIFNDTQVIKEGFLEDINNILSSREVPNLYKPDELEEVVYAPLCGVSCRHHCVGSYIGNAMWVSRSHCCVGPT